MKTINRLFAAALVLFAAAACYNKEIEAPDNQQDPQTPDVSEQTGLKITASIIQTRVTYTDGTTTLNQQWEKGENGDIVFGFIDDANHTPVVLKVDDIINGVATLVPTTGEEALSAMDENTYVNLIYTGGSSQSLVPSDETYSYSIDMTDQDGKIPACMHARARKEGNAIEFDFVNDCAILEIVGITGVEEDSDWVDGKTELSSVTVSGVNTSLSYKYANGGTGYALSELRVSNANGPSITISPETGSLYLDNNGNIVDNAGNSARILMAVPANNTSPMEITVRAGSFGSSYALSSGLSNSTCYVVKAQDVVAKTEDGLYFKTVTGAFDHASTIKNSYKTAETNIVTLVRNCGLAGIKDGTSNVGGSSPLVINGYDVTLDLNGHVLSLAGKKDFFVVNGVYDNDEEDYVQEPQTIKNTFIITDSKGKKADDEYDGKIYYLSDDEEEDNCDLDGTYMIYNLGNLQIDGGTIWHNDDWSVVSNYASGELTINGGTLHSESYVTIYNDGTVTINNGTISVGDECEYDVISNNNKLTVNDGTISSESSVAIHNYSGGELTINGGKISSAAPKYINNDGDLVDNMGTVTNTGGTLTILGGTIKTTSDLVGHSALWTNAQADISGGTISSINGYAIYAEGGAVNISQGNEELCEISTETESTLLLLNNTSGTISGGTIMSSGKCAVSVNQTSTLTVSGGIIICTGTNPDPTSNSNSYAAIQCRANKEGDNPTLIVTWPEGGYTADTNEPLLYSTSDTPIAEMSSKMDENDNYYSTVTIQGGCLYTGVNGGAFFRQYEGTYTPLQDGDGSYFYTNSLSMRNVDYAGISLNSEAQTKSIPAYFHKIPNVDGPLSFGNNYIKIVRQD